MILGCDPGFSGAIALLDPSTGSLVLHDMPVLPNTKGKTELDLHTLAGLLALEEPGPHVAVIEQVWALPNQGVSATFRFGQSFGALQMACIGHGHQTHYIPSMTWKKYFKLSSDKGVSRGLAMRRFPDNAPQFARVKDDGRAEAALIALYGWEVLCQHKSPNPFS